MKPVKRVDAPIQYPRTEGKGWWPVIPEWSSLWL